MQDFHPIDLSIVIATLGRLDEVDSLISSIYLSDIDNKYNLEILIIDQNFSDLLDRIILKYKDYKYPISHYKVSFRGLSKAKNFGTTKARGKYICFVDDDAEFLMGTINYAVNLLETTDADAVAGKCIDRSGNNSVIKFKESKSKLTVDSFENQFVESTMFFKHETSSKFPYDEQMGVGAFYGAEEGYDVVYRMLLEKNTILYDPNIKFYHPQTIKTHSSIEAARRAYNYRKGFAFLCKKHGFKNKYYKRVFLVLLYMPYLMIFKTKDLKYYIGELLGLLVGYTL